MKRETMVLALAAALAWPLAARAQDRVQFLDRAKGGKPATVQGGIEAESVGGIKIKPSSGPAREIATSDLVDVAYEAPASVRLTKYPSALKADRELRFADALKEYQALLPEVGTAAKFKRHVEFRIAALKGLKAEQEPTEAIDAIKALEEFRATHPNCWQLVPAVKQVGRLKMARADYEGASKTFADFMKTDGLDAETRQDMQLLAIDALMRARKFADAEQLVQAALRTAAGPQAERLKVYQLGCKATPATVEATAKELQGLIEKSDDRRLKALAYNTLGDCYTLAKRPKDALWAHLWVDVVYNQDRFEAGKAAERLAKLFKELNDDARAEEYHAKAQRLR